MGKAEELSHMVLFPCSSYVRESWCKKSINDKNIMNEMWLESNREERQYLKHFALLFLVCIASVLLQQTLHQWFQSNSTCLNLIVNTGSEFFIFLFLRTREYVKTCNSMMITSLPHIVSFKSVWHKSIHKSELEKWMTGWSSWNLTSFEQKIKWWNALQVRIQL